MPQPTPQPSSVKLKSYQDTPNPNAIKCLLSGRITDTSKSYFSPADAAADPLASRLFAIPGVTNLLIHPDWITLGKRPETPWKEIKAAFERVLHDTP